MVSNKIDSESIEFEEMEAGEAFLKINPKSITEKISITYLGKDFPLMVKMTDLNRKEVINQKIYNTNEELDLSGVASVFSS